MSISPTCAALSGGDRSESSKKTRVFLCLLLAAAPAWAQKARPVEGMSEQQRADYRKLMRGYVETSRTRSNTLLVRGSSSVVDSFGSGR